MELQDASGVVCDRSRLRDERGAWNVLFKAPSFAPKYLHFGVFSIGRASCSWRLDWRTFGRSLPTQPCWDSVTGLIKGLEHLFYRERLLGLEDKGVLIPVHK